MTTEELLKPRYKVIADYPQHPHNGDDKSEYKFIEGDILMHLKVNDIMIFRRIGRCGYMSVGVPCISNPEKYPKIFKEMFWWEDRDLKDMPEYIQYGTQAVYRVRWDFTENNLGFIAWAADREDYNLPLQSHVNPVTEQEYNEYKTTIKP